jgi:hypothetical protein
MTAGDAARIEAPPRADPVEVFRARAEARAILSAVGELTLHDAVDQLQAAAVRDGLVAAIGQDEVQAIFADAFAPYRDDLPIDENCSISDAPPIDETPAVSAALSNDTFAPACRAADEKQWRKPHDPRLARLRELMADDVSIERAFTEVSKPAGVAESTLRTAKYLVQQGDVARFRNWLDRHSAEERTAIHQHLEAKRCRLRQTK